VLAYLQGKRLLRQWFLRPVVQLEVLADRHDTIELLLEAPSTNDALRAAMKQVRRGRGAMCC
jgi:DNA mismatch repair ATPase MutS